MLCPDQRLAKRAALPEHLRLGVTLPGMRELLSQLPNDAVKKVNARLPRGAGKRVGCFTRRGKPKFPKNVTENGYVNQFFIALWAKQDKMAVCSAAAARAAGRRGGGQGATGGHGRSHGRGAW